MLLVLLGVAAAGGNGGPTIELAVSSGSGAGPAFTIVVDGATWLSATNGPSLCIAGVRITLSPRSRRPDSGTDAVGNWCGTTVGFGTAGATLVEHTFKRYAALPEAAVLTARFVHAVNTTGCGGIDSVAAEALALNTSTRAAARHGLELLTWVQSLHLSSTSDRLGSLATAGIETGPVVITDPSTRTTVVWSTLDSHKVVPQQNSNDVYRMGLSAAFQTIDAGFSHSVLLCVARGGPTAGMYAWGAVIQAAHRTHKVADVTLSHIGYFTDDGAYYYQWDRFPAKKSGTFVNATRRWPAEVGLVKVKEALYIKGVPISYVQLDDWWYNGYAYNGNGGVRAVVDWHADPGPRLFPHGLPAFADTLDLPLMLYTPFFSEHFNWTGYEAGVPVGGTGINMQADQRLPTAASSRRFYDDLYDLGTRESNGRFVAYEMDFLGANFRRYPLFFSSMDAADVWFAGMADAAMERNLSVQYCLPSPTDMLVSLRFPAVTQGRASGDYGFATSADGRDDNVATLGGSSLLFGATGIAPSKDTLWTNGTQPGSIKWTGVPYNSQPHVVLDAVLATLSLGPVGISDAFNWTDQGLIGQAFRSAGDGTLLRPSRPLSSVDSELSNLSRGKPTHAVRGTHSAIPIVHIGGGSQAELVTHYVVSFGTQPAITIPRADLFPAVDPAAARLGTRAHVFDPGPAQTEGCVTGGSAARSCMSTLPVDAPLVLPATSGTEVNLIAVHTPLPNGAYLLGELSKFVHVAPQRFASLVLDGHGPCGFVVNVLGSPGEVVEVVAVDPGGKTYVATARVPAAGVVAVEL